jgi:hypothetical protein
VDALHATGMLCVVLGMVYVVHKGKTRTSTLVEPGSISHTTHQSHNQ